MRLKIFFIGLIIITGVLISGCSNSSNTVVTPAQTPMKAITLSGTGANVHTISIPKNGVYIISASATPTGKSYGDFSVYVTDINGLGYDGYGQGLLFNEFVEPSYQGTKSVRLSSGKYMVSVESHCSYNIIINPS
jgi:ABC-type Fe3+-hydroxamate transport system substrate-binding protein